MNQDKVNREHCGNFIDSCTSGYTDWTIVLPSCFPTAQSHSEIERLVYQEN